MKITCIKRYVDLPFAHRQPAHDGHCALVHGHNWGFEFEFSAEQLDECGFVVDFGKLKWLKEWLAGKFDHTLVVNQNDPSLLFFSKHEVSLWNIVSVPDCSCEGLAVWVLGQVSPMISFETHDRVSLIRVTVFEDSKNSATARA